MMNKTLTSENGTFHMYRKDGSEVDMAAMGIEISSIETSEEESPRKADRHAGSTHAINMCREPSNPPDPIAHRMPDFFLNGQRRTDR